MDRPQACSNGPSRKPAKAFYSPEKSEFFLMYDDVRLSNSPEQSLFDFCQTTYNAGANLAHWDRAELEKPAAYAGARA